MAVRTKADEEYFARLEKARALAGVLDGKGEGAKILARLRQSDRSLLDTDLETVQRGRARSVKALRVKATKRK